MAGGGGTVSGTQGWGAVARGTGGNTWPVVWCACHHQLQLRQHSAAQARRSIGHAAAPSLAPQLVSKSVGLDCWATLEGRAVGMGKMQVRTSV